MLTLVLIAADFGEVELEEFACFLSGCVSGVLCSTCVCWSSGVLVQEKDLTWIVSCGGSVVGGIDSTCEC